MKTGEEKFDDEIRQKLRHSEVTPPINIFNQIIPPPDKKKWLVWVWFAGVLLLGTTALLLHNTTSNESKTKNVKNIFNSSESIQEKDTKLSVGAKSIYSNSKNKSLDLSEPNQNENSTVSITASPQKTNGLSDIKKDSHHSNSKLPSKNKKTTNKTLYYNSIQENDDLGLENRTDSELSTSANPPLVYNYDHLYATLIFIPFSENNFPKQQIIYPKNDSTEFYSHLKSKYSVELVASGVSYYSSISSELTDTLANRLLNARPVKSPVSFGFNVGLKMNYALNNHFSTNFGLRYSHRKYTFETDFDEFYKALHVDTIIYSILFPFSPPQPVTEYDTSVVTFSRKKSINHDITFNVVSAFGEIRYSIPLNRYTIEPQVGVVFDFLTFNNGTSNFNPDIENVSANKYYKHKIQIGIQGGVQLGYSLGEKIDLLLQTEYQYSINDMETQQKFYTEKTNSLSFGVGIRYKIIKREAAKTK